MKLQQLIMLGVLCGSTAIHAEVFQASGIGDTPDLAKQDAVNNAIKKSVGEFVLNKEELNGEQFTQKIINHSNAYINSIDVVNQEKLADNQYKTTVSVDIESQKLIGILEDKKTAVLDSPIDMEGMEEISNQLTQRDLNEKNKQSFDDLLEELYVKPVEEHKELVKVEISGKLKPVKPAELKKRYRKDEYDLEHKYKDVVFLELPVTLTVLPSYIESVKRIIKEISVQDSNHSRRVRVCNPTPNKDCKTYAHIALDAGYKLGSHKVRHAYAAMLLHVKLLDEDGYDLLYEKIPAIDVENHRNEGNRSIYRISNLFLQCTSEGCSFTKAGSVSGTVLLEVNRTNINKIKKVKVNVAPSFFSQQ